jgi:hypothetical protein
VTAPASDELRQLVVGLALTRCTDDQAAWAALRYSTPVDDRELLEVALDVIIDMASLEDSETVPTVGAEGVLRRWALWAAEE